MLHLSKVCYELIKFWIVHQSNYLKLCLITVNCLKSYRMLHNAIGLLFYYHFLVLCCEHFGIEAFMKFNNELNAMNILAFWFYEINPWTFASESI